MGVAQSPASETRLETETSRPSTLVSQWSTSLQDDTRIRVTSAGSSPEELSDEDTGNVRLEQLAPLGRLSNFLPVDERPCRGKEQYHWCQEATALDRQDRSVHTSQPP